MQSSFSIICTDTLQITLDPRDKQAQGDRVVSADGDDDVRVTF